MIERKKELKVLDWDYYVKVFTNFKELFSVGIDFKVFMYIAIRVNFNTNMLLINNRNLPDILNDLDMSRNSFYKKLNRIVKLDIIRRASSGVYMINPDITFRGEESKRKQKRHDFNYIKKYEKRISKTT